MKHVVIVTLDGQAPKQFELKGKRIGLGRGEENDITLEVDAVSSNHLEFHKTDDGYEVRDLDSTNGTRINGKKVEAAALSDGDRLLIGETVPCHFLKLAEGETWEAAAAEGSESDQHGAAQFVAMSDRLEKLEANIEEKQVEAERITAHLAELRATHQQQLTDYAEAQLALDQLQQQLEAKRQEASASPQEISELESALLENTQKVKLMTNTLAAQKQEISQLEQQGPGPVMPRVNPHAPESAPAAAPAPVLPTPLPAAPSAGKPIVPSAPVASPTVRLMKTASPKGPAAAPTMVVRKKKPEAQA